MKCLIWDRCSPAIATASTIAEITAVLDLCRNMAEEEFLPCAAEHDENEPIFKDEQAITLTHLKHV